MNWTEAFLCVITLVGIVISVLGIFYFLAFALDCHSWGHK